MKKPLNYRLQMYRALAKTMCTICWFRWIFLWFCPFLCTLTGFLCRKFISLQPQNSKRGDKMQVDEEANNKSNFLVDLFIRYPSTLIL